MSLTLEIKKQIFSSLTYKRAGYQFGFCDNRWQLSKQIPTQAKGAETLNSVLDRAFNEFALYMPERHITILKNQAEKGQQQYIYIIRRIQSPDKALGAIVFDPKGDVLNLWVYCRSDQAHLHIDEIIIYLSKEHRDFYDNCINYTGKPPQTY